MKEKRILEALGDIKDIYIEEVIFEDKENTEFFKEKEIVNVKAVNKEMRITVGQRKTSTQVVLSNENNDKKNLSSELQQEKIQGKKMTNVHSKKSYGYWVGIVASIALVLMIGGKVFEMNRTSNGELIFETEVYGLPIDLGFSVAPASDGIITIEENTQFLVKNPWKWNSQREKLTYPIYKNLSYVNLAGVPVYFSEAELLSMTEQVAKQLGTKVIEWDYNYQGEISSDSKERSDRKPYQICAKSDLAEIMVNGNGKISISFYEPVALLEDYVFSNEYTYLHGRRSCRALPWLSD